MRSRLLRCVVLAVSALATMAGGHADTAQAQSTVAAERGLVFRGLSARGAQPCPNGYVVLEGGRPGGCTHGPDPAPVGVDVRRRRSTEELRRTAATGEDGGEGLSSARAVTCVGDGVSGDRIQLVYARASDMTERYSQIAPLIEGWAYEMNQAFADSAAENGGIRNLRFVTSACRPVVSHITLSPAGDDNMGATRRDLYDQGHNRSDRKDVVLVDASVYCGIGYVAGNVGRMDQGCWASRTALHELTHNFNAVSLSAPNSSGGYHCTDESDRMCYSDSPHYPVMRPICASFYERLLDCNGDDYFNARPPAENFLSRNPRLNVADTTFSVADGGTVPVFLPASPPSYQGARYRLRLDNADDDQCAYVLTPSGQRVRIFCVGYRGQREADITGALIALAEGRPTVALELAATNRAAGKTYGFRLERDGAAILDDRDGIAGLTSSSAPDGAPDPTTGWTRFYGRTLTLDVSTPPPPPPPGPTQVPNPGTQQSPSPPPSQRAVNCRRIQVLHTVRYRQRYRDRRGNRRYRWATKPHLHRQRYRDRRGRWRHRSSRHYMPRQVCS